MRRYVEANRCPAKVRGTRLRPRLIEGDGREALLAVFNDSRTQRLADRISDPPEYRTLMDIDRNEAVPLDGGALNLEVDAEDVRVFHLWRCVQDLIRTLRASGGCFD